MIVYLKNTPENFKFLSETFGSHELDKLFICDNWRVNLSVDKNNWIPDVNGWKKPGIVRELVTLDDIIELLKEKRNDKINKILEMKINFTDVKIVPSDIDMEFGICVYGKPNEKIQEWINYWNLSTSDSGQFTNIEIPEDFEKMFELHDPFVYMDGFSPNLNKNLHVGHLSNFVIANALQHMGVTKNTIAILGDTLEGLDHAEAYMKFTEMCEKFKYGIDEIYYASEQKLNEDLVEGEDNYEGTKIFELPSGEKMVGIKKTGESTYFYQDVALAKTLNDSTLYVTGHEQNNHFEQLNSLVNNDIQHAGLGLVLIDGKKMSSSEGNVIFLEEMFDILGKEFNDEHLIYNILSAQFLKSNLGSNKNVLMKDLSKPKSSVGLYLSYSLARIQGAGVVLGKTNFNKKLKFLYLKAQKELNPSLILKELENIAKKINQLYLTHTIKDHKDNQLLFKELGDQLLSGMLKLGMFNTKKV